MLLNGGGGGCALAWLSRSCWWWHNVWLGPSTFLLLRLRSSNNRELWIPLPTTLGAHNECVCPVILPYRALWHTANRKPFSPALLRPLSHKKSLIRSPTFSCVRLRGKTNLASDEWRLMTGLRGTQMSLTLCTHCPPGISLGWLQRKEWA